jgi:hypothetical protein
MHVMCQRFRLLAHALAHSPAGTRTCTPACVCARARVFVCVCVCSCAHELARAHEQRSGATCPKCKTLVLSAASTDPLTAASSDSSRHVSGARSIYVRYTY